MQCHVEKREILPNNWKQQGQASNGEFVYAYKSGLFWTETLSPIKSKCFHTDEAKNYPSNTSLKEPRCEGRCSFSWYVHGVYNNCRKVWQVSIRDCRLAVISVSSRTCGDLRSARAAVRCTIRRVSANLHVQITIHQSVCAASPNVKRPPWYHWTRY